MIKKLFTMSIVLGMVIFLIATVAYSHPGKTDEYGGHYDNETGEYHYHHGYPAHEHIDGKCQYDFEDKTNYSSGASSSTATKKTEYHVETPDPLSPEIADVNNNRSPVPSLTTNKNDINMTYIIICGIIALVISIYIISAFVEKYRSEKKNYEQLSIQLQEKYDELEKRLCSKYNLMTKKYMQDEKNKILQDRKLLEKFLEDKKKAYPEMAKLFADYEYYIANNTARYLNGKNHPAKKTAECVRDFGMRNKELMQKLKETEYELLRYKNYQFSINVSDDKEE